MAKLIRHNWQSLAVVGLILTAVVAMSIFTNETAGPVLGQQIEPAVLDENDVDVYQQVDRLRKQLCLTNGDLAAIGCSRQTAEQALGTLIAWCTLQRSALEQVQAGQRDARRTLRAALRRIHIGPRDEALMASVPRLKEQLAQADQQHQQKVQSAIVVVGAVLSNEQNAMWQTIRGNAAAQVPPDLRCVAGLNDRQIQTLKSAAGWQIAGQGPLADAVSAVLSASQQSARDAAEARQRQLMPEMLEVEKQLLALPLVLRPQTDSALEP